MFLRNNKQNNIQPKDMQKIRKL